MKMYNYKPSSFLRLHAVHCLANWFYSLSIVPSTFMALALI